MREFIFLGSVISDLSLEAELNKRIGKATVALARLSKHMWDNIVTKKTKIIVYKHASLEP